MSRRKLRKKADPRLALTIARAQLRAVRTAVGHLSASQVEYHGAGPEIVPKFIQCWAVNRGYASVTQALDSAGKVWERVSLMEEKMVGDKKIKVLGASWWVPVAMERRAAATEGT